MKSSRFAPLWILALVTCTPFRNEGSPPDALLSELPTEGGTCEVIASPDPLPAAGLLLDSAAVARSIRDYAASLDPAPVGHALLSMFYDSAGLNYRREVIEHSVTDVVADSVERLVFDGVREVDAEGADLPWYVRLRLDLEADRVSMQIGRSELCPPVPRDARLESQLHTVFAPGIRYRDGRRERLIVVRVEVSTAGQVIGTEVVHGPILTTDQRRNIDDYVRRFSFEPATIDGRSVPGFLDIPVVVQN